MVRCCDAKLREISDKTTYNEIKQSILGYDQAMDLVQQARGMDYSQWMTIQSTVLKATKAKAKARAN